MIWLASCHPIALPMQKYKKYQFTPNESPTFHPYLAANAHFMSILAKQDRLILPLTIFFVSLRRNKEIEIWKES